MEKEAIDKVIRGLRRLDKKGDLEVEHILKLVLTGDATLVEPLRALSLESGWRGINDELFVPLAAWTEAVCEYFAGGIEAMAAAACKGDELAPFALGVLETLNNQAAAEALVRVLRALDVTDTDARAHTKRAVAAFNLVVSLSNGVALNETDRQEANRVLVSLLAGADADNDDGMRSLCLYAMRGTGDEATAAAILKRAPMPYPYDGIEKSMARHIRKRLKAGSLTV